MIHVIKNIIIENQDTKPFLANIFYSTSAKKLPLVIFMHGYKGYKDWGAWSVMCTKIAENGFYVVSFNASFNRLLKPYF